MLDIVGVLLAGGESRRFGRPKAFAKYNGLSFWEHSFYAMKDVTDDQMIISHPSFVDHFQNEVACKVVQDDDEVRGMGPLAGIYTAMNHNEAEWFVILSCDIPLIREETIRSLLDFRKHDVKAVIPKISGKIQPLIGLYHHSVFPMIKNQLTNHEYKIIALFNKIKVLYVSENDMEVNLKSFSNINSQKDYSKLITDF